MATIWNNEFSKIVNTLHSLEADWARARNAGTDTTTIERTIQQLIAKMTDEQLDAYGEYGTERLREAEANKKDLLQTIAAMETEVARRKTS